MNNAFLLLDCSVVETGSAFHSNQELSKCMIHLFVSFSKISLIKANVTRMTSATCYRMFQMYSSMCVTRLLAENKGKMMKVWWIKIHNVKIVLLHANVTML